MGFPEGASFLPRHAKPVVIAHCPHGQVAHAVTVEIAACDDSADSLGRDAEFPQHLGGGPRADG